MGGGGGLPHTKRAKMVQKLKKKGTERASQKDHKDILGRYVQGAKFIKHLFCGILVWYTNINDDFSDANISMHLSI